MKTAPVRAAILIIAASLLSHCGPGPADDGTESVAGETAIRELIDSYVAEFEKRDLEALAAHWSADAVYQTADGRELSGRQAITDALKEALAETQGAGLVITLDSLTTTEAGAATGNGMAFAYIAGLPPQQNTYTARFKKENGHWMIDALTESALPAETAVPSQTNEALEPLAWMTGTWVDHGADSTVYYHCDWTPDGNFLNRSYAVVTDAGIHSAGHEIIGWDDTAKKFLSRVFDSTGDVTVAEWSAGDGEGTWTRKSSGTLGDGTKATAVQIIRRIDDQSYGMRFENYTLGDQPLPDTDEVTVVKIDPEK